MLDGKPYHVGFPYGAEGLPRGGWGTGWSAQPNVGRSGPPQPGLRIQLDFLRYFVKQDPAWSYTAFDLSTYTAETRVLQATLSPMDPDLSAFRSRGGKLLLYHGWSDPALSPFVTTRYIDAVLARDATAAGDVRLFMLPGVLHCFGGPGPDRIDFLDTLDTWARRRRRRPPN